MAVNLLDSVQGLFSRDVIGRIAGSLGEGEANTGKALSAIVPLVLGNIVSRAESGIDGASSILGMAKNAAASARPGQFGLVTGPAGPSGSVIGDSDGQQLLGGKATSIISAVSGYAGIRESSAASLLRTTTPAALQLLGQQVNEQGLTAGGLANLLSGQKAAIMAAIPTGLGSLVGGKVSSGMVSPPPTGGPPGITPSTMHGHGTVNALTEDERRRNWLWPLVLGILVILLCYLLARSCNRTSARNSTLPDTVARVPPAEPVSVRIRLPDKTELDAYKGGVEDRLAAFLSSHDPADTVSSTRWFDFDQLNFKTGSAELTDSSMKQVRNIAAILRAYPNARIKIGGYTDKTGNENANLKLSQQRADVVLDAVRKAGAPAVQLVGAQGYGSQFAKAEANAPDAQRRQDRRISINVKQK